jgi:hypothetical protein
MSGDEFIEEFEERIRRGRLDAKVRVELSAPRPDVVSLDLLEVRDPADRGNRLATTALRLLLQVADETGMVLEVTPLNLGGHLSDEVLASWYERHGFVAAPSVDHPRLMRRAPHS